MARIGTRRAVGGGAVAFTPANISGLQLWLKADTGIFTDDAATTAAVNEDDSIAVWQDQSGNGYHVIQATAAKRPTLKLIANGINNKAALLFDGAGDLLRNATADWLSTNTTGSVFAVYRLYGILAEQQTLFGTADEGSADTSLMQFKPYRSAASPRFIIYQRSAGDVVGLITGSTAIAGNVNVVGSWRSTGAAYAFRINGADEVNAVVSGADNGDWFGDTVNRDSLIVGATKDNTERQWFRGYLSEILVYDTNITGANLVNVEAYLNSRYGGTVAPTINPPDPDPATAVNAAAALVTPTYDGTGVAVHPDVYDAGAGNTWNGYRYWMAMTPYAGSNSAVENPSILASADGTTWVVPAGLVNPIDPAPGGGNYNSDPDLVMDGSTLYCIYRELVTVGGNETETIYERHSTDGVNWSAQVSILTATYPTGGSRIKSPAVIKDGATYYMWSVNQVSSLYLMQRRSASAITGPWSDPIDCGLVRAGAVAFSGPDHVDVIKVNANYYAFISDTTRGYLATSTDGRYWKVDAGITLAPSAGWDTGIYRGSLVWNGVDFDLWYSASGATDWHIGRTSVTGVVVP